MRYSGNVVTFRTLLTGFETARSRFVGIRNSTDGEKLFLPLFETLNWAVALDDHVAAHWSPHGTPLGLAWRTHVRNSDIVSAVRLVRNRVHHQWADALELQDGRAYPTMYAKSFVEWCWRSLDSLPVSERGGKGGVAE
jgi:hypothetical protein